MRIGFLGAGTMASAFAPRWAKAGHEIFVGGRTAAKAQRLAEAVGGHAGTLRNAVYLRDFSQVRWDGRSLAEQAEFLAMGSQVVKAFNLGVADVWRMDPPSFDGRALAVPYCGAPQAKHIVRPLIEALGCRAVDVGDLSQARHLEAMAILVINIIRNGAGPKTVFNLIPGDDGLNSSVQPVEHVEKAVVAG